jgi:hypothetical protein
VVGAVGMVPGLAVSVAAGRATSGRSCGRGTGRDALVGAGCADSIFFGASFRSLSFLGAPFFGASAGALALKLFGSFERVLSAVVSELWREIFDLRRSSVSRSKGRPELLDKASCLAENGTGAGGAAIFLTTCRGPECCGGAAAWLDVSFLVPRTLFLEGTTGGAMVTGVSFIWRETWTAVFATGCESETTLLGTAVTAPGTS